MRERKEDMCKGMMHEGCKMNEKMKLKHKTKTLKNATKHKEHDMLRMMEHDVNVGMIKTQEHVKC